MSQPGIKYVVYGFLGNRTGRKGGTNQSLPAGTGLGENCYRFKIFDSSSNEQPIILSPLHEILENTAGTLSFTLLRNAKITPVFRKTGESATTETSYDHPVEARPFMFVKQTEFVIFRYMLIKKNNTEVYKVKELWSGRLDSISKDFYGDWKITFEGELAYLNDFYVNYEKTSNGGKTPEASTLFINFIKYHNNRITDLPVATIDTSSLPKMGTEENPTNPQSVPALNRKFKVGSTDAYSKDATNTSSTLANLEDGYTIREGTVWSNIQVLLDRYGGHVEIKKVIKDGVLTRYINWNKSETKGELPGYNSGDFQPLKFGVNLLDFIEENDASDLFTVLIPHGSPEQITTKDSEGKITTKSGDNITIKKCNKEHPGTPYIYDPNVVRKYGWIEKIETWSISDPSKLYDVAYAYFKDYRIDAKTIQAKAFDLKNLLVTETDAAKRNSYLSLESLYLYDVVQVKVEDPGAQYITALSWNNKKFPVQGIRIPLDKFPTDTEYTISNKRARRGILQPGTLSSKIEPKKTGEEEQQKKDEDKKKDEAPKPVVKPIASEYGIDDILAHYPPVYLDHAHNYWRGKMEECTSNKGIGSIDFTESGSASYIYLDVPTGEYKIQPINGGPVEIIRSNGYRNGADALYTPCVANDAEGNAQDYTSSITITGSRVSKYETVFGYKEGTFVQGINPMLEYNNFNDVFYTDDLNNRDAYSRQRTNDTEESITNWYEKAYYYDSDPVNMNDGVSYLIDAATKQYKYDDSTVGGKANITIDSGLWFNSIPNTKPDTPEIETYRRSELKWSTGEPTILDDIRTLPLFGTTLQSIFSDVGIEIGIYNNRLAIDMLYNPNIQAEPSRIRMMSIMTKPSTFSNNSDYYYTVGKRMINENTAEIYYSYFDIPKILDAPQKNTIAKQNELIKFGVSPREELPDTLCLNLKAKKNPEANDYGPNGLKPLGNVGCWGYTIRHDSDLDMDVYEPVGFYTVVNDDTGYVFASSLGAYTIAWQQAVRNSLTPEPATGTPVYTYPDTSTVVGSSSFSYYFCNGGHPWSNQSGYHAGTSPLEDLIIAREMVQKNLDASETYKSKSYEKRLNYAKSYYNTAPFMIVSKCVDAVTGNESNHPYGVTYFSLNNDLTITKNNNTFYLGGSAVPLSANRTGSATPLMICYDTLHTPYYLFHRDSPTADVTVANPMPLPYVNDPHSPIMILGRVGGRHTQNIAKGMYMLLSGPTFSSYVTAEEAISPISGEKDYKAPDSSHMTEQNSVKDGNDIWHRWYLSDDMVTEEKIKQAGVQKWDVSSFVMDAWGAITPEQMKKYYYTSDHCQLVAIGNNFYMKTTNNIYSKIDVAEPEGE